MFEPMERTNRWGQQYEDFYKKRAQGAQIDKRKPIIDQLTTTFTRNQLELLLKQNDMETEARFFISQWKRKGWIKKVEKNTFRKLL